MDFLSKIVSGNVNRIKQNIFNSFVQDLDIQKGSYDEFEKGKWNVGDQKFYHGTMHYVAELKPDGSPRWRRVKKTSVGSDDASTSSSTKSQTTEKPNKSGDKGDEKVKDHSEKKQSLFAKNVVDKLKNVLKKQGISDEEFDKLEVAISNDEKAAKKILSIKLPDPKYVSPESPRSTKTDVVDLGDYEMICKTNKSYEYLNTSGKPKPVVIEEYSITLRDKVKGVNLIRSDGSSIVGFYDRDKKREEVIMHALYNYFDKKSKKSESSTSSDKPSVSKKTSEKPKKNDSQIKSVMNRIKEDFKNGVPMLQKNSKTETSYQTRRVGIKEFEEKLKTDYGKKFAKSFNEFSFKDVDFRNDRDGKYDVYDYFFNERGFTKIEDIDDIYADNHRNELNLGLWIKKSSIRQSFLSREWDKKEYKIPYNGKKYHFVAETNLFMKKEGDGSYVPKLEFKINLVGVSNGKKIRRRNLTLGVCYTDSIDYPYSQSKEEESKSFEKLKEQYKKDGQRCRDVALYNFVSNFDGYFSKIFND